MINTLFKKQIKETQDEMGGYLITAVILGGLFYIFTQTRCKN